MIVSSVEGAGLTRLAKGGHRRRTVGTSRMADRVKHSQTGCFFRFAQMKAVTLPLKSAFDFVYNLPACDGHQHPQFFQVSFGKGHVVPGQHHQVG